MWKILAYQMPTHRANKNVIYFVATKQHSGIYPASEVIAGIEDQFWDYGYSKRTLKSKYNQKIPFDLLERMALYSYKWINSYRYLLTKQVSVL